MTINKAGLALIKEFEGFRANAYLDPVGIPTIGYGTTSAAGVGITVKLGMRISEAQAEMYLSAAINKFAAQIDPLVKVPINENERAAFLSLAYNIGPGAFAKSSALRKFNDGDKRGAADAILLWNKAGGRVLAGLTRRRDAERALFLSQVMDHKPAISAPQNQTGAKPEPNRSQNPLAALLAFIMSMFRKGA